MRLPNVLAIASRQNDTEAGSRWGFVASYSMTPKLSCYFGCQIGLFRECTFRTSVTLLVHDDSATPFRRTASIASLAIGVLRHKFGLMRFNSLAIFLATCCWHYGAAIAQGDGKEAKLTTNPEVTYVYS